MSEHIDTNNIVLPKYWIREGMNVYDGIMEICPFIRIALNDVHLSP